MCETTFLPGVPTASLFRAAVPRTISSFRRCIFRPLEKQNMTTYAIVIEQRGSCFRAYVPDLPGCTATGNSLAEAEAAVREVLRNLPPAGAAFAAQANQALRSGGYAWVSPAR